MIELNKSIPDSLLIEQNKHKLSDEEYQRLLQYEVLLKSDVKADEFDSTGKYIRGKSMGNVLGEKYDDWLQLRKKIEHF
jgi:hypothetical protein